jgi:hypothetical protein
MESFKFGNGKWAVKEDYALAYNDENGNFKPLPFDFNRDSIGTRVNREGLIEVVPSGRPRIDFTDNTSGHLLLEPSRKNDLTYSEFTNADPVGWTIGFGTGTYDYDLVSYKGRGALKQTQTTTGRSYQYQNVTLLASTTYTLSMYVDISNSNLTNLGEDIMHVIADDETGDNTAEWQDVDTNTGRVSITFTTGSDTSVQIRIGLGVTGSTLAPNQVLTYSMPQLEAGSYATSYIPTEGSAVTRSAEVANGAGNSAVFNDSEGVLYAEISALANDGNFRFISINDGDYTDRVAIAYTSSDNEIRCQVTVGGIDSYIKSQSITDATEFIKIAVKYKASDFAIWINGAEYQAQSSGSIFPSGTLDNLSFDNGAGGSDFYGKVKDLRVYKTALSDSELQALTS